VGKGSTGKGQIPEAGEREGAHPSSRILLEVWRESPSKRKRGKHQIRKKTRSSEKPGRWCWTQGHRSDFQNREGPGAEADRRGVSSARKKRNATVAARETTMGHPIHVRGSTQTERNAAL